MRILLSGTHGFVGSHLAFFLKNQGHEVIPLCRSSNLHRVKYTWDPSRGAFNKEEFEGFDAVIHLAGANIAGGVWTKKQKDELFKSRCRDSWLLSQILSKLKKPPRIVIAASAIGFYGDRGCEILTEESSKGVGFLSDLCETWEGGFQSIKERGTRVVHTRFGHVLGRDGGMLARLIPLFKWGLGGRWGSGAQMMSWVALEDLCSAMEYILQHETLSGPVNVTAPGCVTQAEFTRQLAKRLHRVAWCHLPASLLGTVLGEMAEALFLSSAHVVPEKLLKAGYHFKSPTLPVAFDTILGS